MAAVTIWICIYRKKKKNLCIPCQLYFKGMQIQWFAIGEMEEED